MTKMLSKEKLKNAKKAGDIFDENESLCKARYRELTKIYHPDAKNGDRDLFEHITELYKKALELIQDGKWEKSNYISLKTDKNKHLQITYQTKYQFELGICYVCCKHVIYILEKDKEKYYRNYLEKVKSLKYATPEMETVMKRTMPLIISNGRLDTGEYYIVLSKTEDVYPLKNLLSYMNEIPGKHVAWIISRLSSICCYLEYNHFVHNGIDINSCFVSPKYHSILLFGGWWYTSKIGDRLLGTTKEIFDLMPVVAKTEKKANTITDLESVKLIGRTLFNEKTCRTLNERTDIPKPIKDFLIRGSGDDAITEMSIWDENLNKAYGQRKFIELNVTEKDIYKN